MSRPDQSTIVLSMADCFVKGRKALYCSSELTTGLRLYTACWDNEVTDRYALAEKLGKMWLRDNVFVVNEQAANTFALSVEMRHSHTTISPACLFIPEWGQHDYLNFWETLIKTRISEVWFNTNWQYSNGCTFEYMAARVAGLPCYDIEGNVLEVNEAIDLTHKAIESLKVRGIDTKKLEENLTLIQAG